MRRSAVMGFLMLSAACSHSRSHSLLLAPAELAQQSGLTPWAISMPFGSHQDGTELVLTFLDQAEASGARFVSDMQVVFVTEENGQPMECRTRLSPPGTAPRSRAQAGIHTASAKPGEKPAALETRSRTELGSELSCGDEYVPRLVTEVYTNIQLPNRSVQKSSQGSTYNHPYNQVMRCVYIPTSRTTTRYAFQDVVDYTPPRTERIREVRPELRLAEAEAECVPRDPSSPAVNRIEGLAYGGEGPRAALYEQGDVVPARVDL